MREVGWDERVKELEATALAVEESPASGQEKMAEGE